MQQENVAYHRGNQIIKINILSRILKTDFEKKREKKVNGKNCMKTKWSVIILNKNKTNYTITTLY